MCHGQILDDAIRRARKEHRCEECGRAIKPGEKYRRAAFKDGADIRTVVDCAQCSALGTALANTGYEACWFVGEVRSNLRDIIGGCAETAREVRGLVRAALEKFR